MQDVPLDPKHRGQFINDHSARSHGGKIMLPPEDLHHQSLASKAGSLRGNCFLFFPSRTPLGLFPLLPFSNTNTPGIISYFSLLEFGLVTTDMTRMQGLASACVLVSFRRSQSQNLSNGTSAGDQSTTSRRLRLLVSSPIS